MSEEEINVSWLTVENIALIFGLIFLVIGVWWTGYIMGYNYVKEYKDDYMSKMCICREIQDQVKISSNLESKFIFDNYNISSE